MSENPYQTPLPGQQAASLGSRTPGALKVICILCIILGVLGLFTSVMGLIGLIFQSQISEFQQNFGAPNQQELQAKIAETQSTFLIPNMILTICNLIIAPALLVGGFGVLYKKSWGQKIFSLALVSAGIFIVVRTILGIFMQMQFFETMKEMVVSQAQSQGGPQAAGMESIMVASMYFGLAVGAAFPLALAVFYLWSWRYLKKERCQEYLKTFSA